jgi:hypothetical protein
VSDSTLNTVSGTSTYALSADVVDILDSTIREQSGTNEIYVNRIAVGTWAKETNKTLSGRPTQVYIERLTTPQVTLWPVPDKVYVYRYWHINRIDGLSSGIDGAPSVPSRFEEPLVAGLAYNVALKSDRPEVLQRVPLLKQLYDEAFRLAADEDRDRSGYQFAPFIAPV